MQLKIVKGDITNIECDAIVNSANSNLIPSGTIDTAIHNTAGPNLARECYRIPTCSVGTCVVTKAYDLPCTYVIHAIAPYSARTSAEQLLADCYKNAIEEAKKKQCTSIAFPLIGSGHKGFSAERALSIALSSIDACIRDNDYEVELLIYLVTYDDETFKLAMSQAKNIIKDDYIGESDINHEMNNLISLCRVNRPDRNNHIWLQRLADSIDGTLVAPVFDEDKDQTMDNRRLIFYQGGPKDTYSIGFWEWSDHQISPGHWRTKATYIEQPSPIEIIVLDDLATVDEMVNTLKTGIHIPSYVYGDVLFAVKNEDSIEAVLGNLNAFNMHPGNDMFITLKADVWTLPYYKLNDDDIFVWKNRKIFRNIELGEAVKHISIRMPTETIKQMFLQRMTWPVFKAQGISKSDWQKFMQFMNAIPEESIPEKLSETYGMSVQEAKSYIAEFLQKVESYVQAEDVDAELIVRMLNSHKNLKWMCEALATQKWREEHKAEIEQARKEIDNIRSKADLEMEKAESQLLAIEQAIDTAEKAREKLLQETDSVQRKLDQLLIDITYYESVKKDTLDATRRKIADAQKDVAGFIADLSMFLPQANITTAPEKKVSLWQYNCTPYGVYPEDEAELATDWKDEFNFLIQNFSQSLNISSAFSTMLAAFVYAAHLNNIPLLIAGPGGDDIAETLSVSLYGNSAGQLILGNECDCDIAEEIKEYAEHVVSIQNMFSKGWSDTLPQAFRKLTKQIVWTHPYAEDLAIEPKGLYNYMLPVLSECFVGSFSEINPWPGKRAEKFVPFVTQKKKRLRIAAFDQLKLSKLLLAQLEKVLSDARELMNNPNTDKDIEVLFGLIPLCVLTGRTDILKEVIETETGISNPVKAEAARYIEEA